MFLSLRTKLIVTLITLLLLTFVINLVYGILALSKDRYSPLYELTSAEAVSQQKIYSLKLKEYGRALTGNNPNFEDEIRFFGEMDENGTVLKVSGQVASELEAIKNEKFKSIVPGELTPVTIGDSRYYIFSIKIAKGLSRFALIQYPAQKDSAYTSLLVSKDGPETIFPELNEKIKKSSTGRGSFLFSGGNRNYIASFERIPGIKLVVVSYIPAEKLSLLSRGQLKDKVFFTIGILLIFIIGGSTLSSRLTKPLSELTELTKEFARGNFANKFQVTTKDEIATLGNSFNQMSEEIQKLLNTKEEMILALEVANTKLEDYNKNLEQKVKERTFEIEQARLFMEAVLNSLDQGLVVFNRDLKCEEIFTKASRSIFYQSPAGQPVNELIGLDSISQIEDLRLLVKLIFSGNIEFENSIPLFPKTFILNNEKHFNLSYYPMRNSSDELLYIVLVATDITEKIKAARDFKEKESQVQSILKILAQKDQFRLLVLDIKDSFAILSKSENFEEAMSMLHTLSGGFSLYSLYVLQDKSREVEDFLKKNQNSGKNFRESSQLYKEKLSELKDLFFHEIQQLDARLGTDFSEEKSDLAHTEPINKYFSPYLDLVKNMSEQNTDKKIELIIEDNSVSIDPFHFRSLFSSLIHCIRNSVDHGIESVDERIALKKEPVGKIILTAEHIQSNLHITLQDDGRGIPDELIRNVYSAHFTTKQTLTETSGRGLGLFAVKAVVEKLGGSVELFSNVSLGTRFSITIPTSMRGRNV